MVVQSSDCRQKQPPPSCKAHEDLQGMSGRHLVNLRFATGVPQRISWWLLSKLPKCNQEWLQGECWGEGALNSYSSAEFRFNLNLLDQTMENRVRFQTTAFLGLCWDWMDPPIGALWHNWPFGNHPRGNYTWTDYWLDRAGEVVGNTKQQRGLWRYTGRVSLEMVYETGLAYPKNNV